VAAHGQHTSFASRNHQKQAMKPDGIPRQQASGYIFNSGTSYSHAREPQ
jgi:hypothetical protein